MPDDTTWQIEEHTRAKHEILRRYLGAWFPILTSSGYNRQIIFLDGFAGPGIYSGGEPGSPLIALETLLTHARFDRWNSTTFRFIFVENHRARYESLQHEIAQFWGRHQSPRPNNIHVDLLHDEFSTAASGIMDDLRNSRSPTFAFIDPFGWSGVPLSTIRSLLSSSRCEVLFNFMFDSVNRFVNIENQEIAQSFAELFGTTRDELAKATDLTGPDRKLFLVDLYKRQLCEAGGFEFVRSFELMNVGRGRTEYFLMFGTRHIKGLTVMKDAMWALDPVSGVCFSGFAGDQQVLFEPEPNFGPLRNAMLSHFRRQTVRIDEIERFVIVDTDYKSTHYKKQVLKPLEDEGLVVCRSNRKIRGTYPEGTVLQFF